MGGGGGGGVAPAPLLGVGVALAVWCVCASLAVEYRGWVGGTLHVQLCRGIYSTVSKDLSGISNEDNLCTEDNVMLPSEVEISLHCGRNNGVLAYHQRPLETIFWH